MIIQRIEGVEVMEVIQIRTVVGMGKDASDPIRPAFQYWSKSGELLAEHDPHLPQATESPHE